LFGLLSTGILCGINNAGQMLCGTIRVMTPETCVLVLDGAGTKWNTEKHANEMEHGKTRERNGTRKNTRTKWNTSKWSCLGRASVRRAGSYAAATVSGYRQ
jgi:hypothetical protein